MRGRARTLLSLAAVSLAGVAGVAVISTHASAARAIAVSISPASGPAGSGAVVRFSVDPKQPCRTVDIFWDGEQIATVKEASGSASLTIPQSAPGTHKVTAVNGCKIGGGTSFTVTTPATPSPRPSPTRTAPPSPGPTPPVTEPPATPTPRRTATPDPTDPAATPTSTPTASPSPSGSATPGPSPSPGGELLLDRPHVRPGEPLTATGSGCRPNAPVVLTSDRDQIGTATADGTGVFVAPVQFTRLEPGRRIVTATCGVVLTTHVDLIVSSSTRGQAGTVVVLIFFVLVGIALLRWQYNSARS
jgi:hypothetical protein